MLDTWAAPPAAREVAARVPIQLLVRSHWRSTCGSSLHRFLGEIAHRLHRSTYREVAVANKRALEGQLNRCLAVALDVQ